MSRVRYICLCALLAAVGVSGEWHDDWGPWVIATEGEPWPLPASRQLFDKYFCLDVRSFDFQVLEQNCDILRNASERYRGIIRNEARIAKLGASAQDETGDCITRLEIRLRNPCEFYPRLLSNESYELRILKRNAPLLTADSVWGILRGLETFSQLVFKRGSGISVRSQRITDRPLLPHRGLLLDTSRHFLPLADILLTLDAMAYNKLNVLHWHIVDDNSFPYESAVYPELSRKGAYHPTMVYTARDIATVIEHARLRGIRVLPEFDTPGHTRSWGQAFPNLLTQCYGTDGQPTGKLGPMNPTQPTLYTFMRQLLTEISNRFPDEYVHLGGDEVPFDCWRSNPEIVNFMKTNNMSTRFDRLEELYVQRILDIAAELHSKPIVWQEVFDNGVTLHEGTAVHIWTGNWRLEMSRVTRLGHHALLSACWYLDHVSSGGDWTKYYDCDPLDFLTSSKNQKNLVLGGEACMWGEFVDRNNVHSRIWPRASAVAERLWSAGRQDEKAAARRLEEHTCRMNRRNVPAQPPNGSGFCLV